MGQARAHQHAGGLGEPANQRGDAKHYDAGEKYPAAPEEICGASAEQHEPAVGQQVGARHPLQALDGEVQRVADRGKRDVEDRRVDEVEKRDGAQQEKGQLAAARRQN